MGLCQRQLEDSVVEDWWLFPRNLLLFWMRKITKQRGSETSPYFDGCFAYRISSQCKQKEVMELNDKEESQATRDHTQIINLSLISLSRF